jgi:hypothetical protein
VRSFGAGELVEHLDQRFVLLSAGARTALPRQRTLRGNDRLELQTASTDVAGAVRSARVFPADFDFEGRPSRMRAGRAGCRSRDHPDPPAGGQVRSCPRRWPDAPLPPAGETIRAYAADRLSVSGAEPAARHQHASYYLALQNKGQPASNVRSRRIWLDRLIT